MSGVNKLFLLGRLTKDPEMVDLPNGSKMTKFTVVTNDRYKDKDGNQQEEAEFTNLVAWSNQAKVIGENKKKGDEIFIVAKKKTSRWEDKETKEPRSKIEFHVTEFEFCGRAVVNKDEDLPFNA